MNISVITTMSFPFINPILLTNMDYIFMAKDDNMEYIHNLNNKIVGWKTNDAFTEIFTQVTNDNTLMVINNKTSKMGLEQILYFTNVK